ncbi:MAG: hypothetical protein RLO81_19450 [Fulvivirga sp.]|uniref:hypothetical protein n=1 Tax=Fulvivirga sp. TaxID=1931237 RepID=UPI0032ED161F
MDRKTFIRNGLLGSAVFLTPNVVSAADNEPYSRDIVKEFVAAGHNNLDRVKEMLANDPNLIHCRHDWGSGDFEEAIEGAGHVGNKEIANYLIESGSRLSIFTLTMLGKAGLVKPVLESYQKAINSIGPHGFTLLHYAKVGGEESAQLYEYLQSKGLKETKVNIK